MPSEPTSALTVLRLVRLFPREATQALRQHLRGNAPDLAVSDRRPRDWSRARSEPPPNSDKHHGKEADCLHSSAHAPFSPFPVLLSLHPSCLDGNFTQDGKVQRMVLGGPVVHVTDPRIC